MRRVAGHLGAAGSVLLLLLCPALAVMDRRVYYAPFWSQASALVGAAG